MGSDTDNIKVLFLLHSSNKYEGSSQSFLCTLDGLMKYGCIPSVVLPSKGSICSELENRDVPYVVLKYRKSIYPSLKSLTDWFLYLGLLLYRIFLNTKAARTIKRTFVDSKPDIIHTNVGPLHMGHYISKRTGIPHVWHVREYQVLDFNMHPLYSMKYFKRMLSSINNYPIAITRGISVYFELGEQSQVIYDGVLKQESARFSVDKEKYFFFAGRLEEAKGIKNLILAFKEIATEFADFSLYVAGDTGNDQYKLSLKALVESSGLADRVIFLGMIDNVLDYMFYASALVVPSVNEGFGRITAEAMFNGCLVIGNKAAGTKEILEENNTGILYQGHDELVQALKTVAGNKPEVFFPMIKKAQKQACELYSEEQNAENIYKFYCQILEKESLK